MVKATSIKIVGLDVPDGGTFDTPVSLSLTRKQSRETKELAYETLITNLPAEAFPPQKPKAMYAMWWGIETSFRNLEHVAGMPNFHSRKSEFVTQGIYANLIMHNMTAAVSQCLVKILTI